ncbi:MAG: SDR family NAD(P)-dependent oxidoreductase [bacterium]
MNDLEGLRGKVALVTGASGGIGEAVARRLAAGGLKVAAVARRADRLEALRAEVAEAGGELLALPADVRDDAAVRRVVGATVERFGGVDVLVNNAGLGRDEPLLTGDPAAWREMVDVNVLALCLFTQAAIASMRARGDVGHVVHIGSMAGHRMPAGTSGAFYAATKHAVRALTEGLRRELHAAGSGVRVTAISPGYVETGFAAVFTGQPDAGQTVYGQYPCVQPAEVADLVAFVLTRPPHVQVHDLLVRPLGQPA